MIHSVPRILPIHIIQVDQEAEHFKDPDSGMCFVQMNSVFLFKLSELSRETVLLLEATKDILEGCRDIKIELLQAYLFVLLSVVVWIKD